MTRTLLVLGITLAAALPAKADITHKIQSSIQLQVDGAASQASRIGSTMAVSGSNISLDTAPVLGTLTAGSAVGYTPGEYSITTAGDAFSCESYIEGDDATPSNTSVSSGVVTSLPNARQHHHNFRWRGWKPCWHDCLRWCNDNHSWWSRNYCNRTSGSKPGNRMMRWLALLFSRSSDSSANRASIYAGHDVVSYRDNQQSHRDNR